MIAISYNSNILKIFYINTIFSFCKISYPVITISFCKFKNIFFSSSIKSINTRTAIKDVIAGITVESIITTNS